MNDQQSQSQVTAAFDEDPDSWVMDRLKECRRCVLHFEARGDKAAAARWKRAERCVDYALAMFMSTARMPDLPEEKSLDLARSVLREIAKTVDHAPSRIEAVRLLLELETAHPGAAS
jgi:dihydroneopterin aldolase